MQYLPSLRRGFYASLLGLFFFSCSSGTQESSIRDEIVRAENSAQLADEARRQLSFEEYELLQGYVARVNPDTPKGQLPVGITLGTMIESQRAFLEAQAPEQSEGSAPSGPTAASEAQALVNPPVKPASQAGKSTPASPPQTSPAASPASETVAASKPEPPPPPATAVVAKGTAFDVRLDQALSSKTAGPGDAFQAVLEDDLVVDGRVLAKSGSRVTGRIVDAKSSGKVKGKASMSIRLLSLETGKGSFDLPSNTLAFEAQGTGKKDARKIAIGSGAGAIIGAIAGGGKGAAIGAAIGGGAGTGVVLATSGDEVEFPVEQLFNFRLEEDVELPVL